MNELLEPFRRLLEQLYCAATIRRIETGVDDGAAWRALCDSGFLDAMVPEDAGGAGLPPAAVASLFIACGEYLVPHAFAETLVARALAALADKQLPTDPVVLWPEDDDGRLCSAVSPAAGAATHALVQRGSRVRLQPLSQVRFVDHFHIAGAALDVDAAPLLVFELPERQIMNWAAALTAAAMAGAMSRVLAMTLDHVNNRQQFDRPLAKFQAVQQQVSVMAERVAAANVAARRSLVRGLPGPSTLDAAVGKTLADDAASLVAAGAHAAHGAIGITAEHDLSLYVRRLKRWQLSFGSAGYWAKLIAEARLAHTGGTTVDFLRAQRA